MRALSRLLLTREASVLALMLTALACLPIALRKAVPDASMTLLLPVVLVGAILGYAAHGPRLRRTWFTLIFLGAGPVMLFLRVGQFSAALIASVGETLRIMPALMLRDFAGNTPDLAAWLAAQYRFSIEVATFAQRVVLWLADALRGLPLVDTAARAFLYGLGLWLPIFTSLSDVRDWLSAWRGVLRPEPALVALRADARQVIGRHIYLALLSQTWAMAVSAIAPRLA